MKSFYGKEWTLCPLTWNSANVVDSTLEDGLDYAFSSRIGFLTACPTNVGTGMRASAMMHLPALVISNQMEKVVRAVNQLGIAVRGLFGEGSDASGSIFQISNQTTLGESEEVRPHRPGQCPSLLPGQAGPGPRANRMGGAQNQPRRA